jgi:anti-sigma B factor antagonist
LVAPSTTHNAASHAENQTFGIVASVESDKAVLGMWGEFDLVTAPTLRVFIDAVMELSQRHVVLDLARLEFIDASGLRRVVEALSRLKAQDGSLTVRSPSAMTAKILEITGLSPELDLRSPADDPAPFASASLSPTTPVAPGAGLSAIDPHRRAMPDAALNEFRREAGLSHCEVWWRYFGLGGMSSPVEVEAYLCGALEPTAHDRDLLAQALNERFSDLGENHPVPYADGTQADEP